MKRSDRLGPLNIGGVIHLAADTCLSLPNADLGEERHGTSCRVAVQEAGDVVVGKILGHNVWAHNTAYPTGFRTRLQSATRIDDRPTWALCMLLKRLDCLASCSEPDNVALRKTDAKA